MERAAILHHAQATSRVLLGHAVVEKDHAVRDVLFQPLAGERSFTLFTGDHDRHAAVLEPAEHPAQLGAQHVRIGQTGKERLDRVENDTLGPHGFYRKLKSDEQALKVVFAGFLDLAALDPHIVDGELLLRLELLHIKAK